MIKKSKDCRASLELLSALEKTHDMLKEQVESLFASLNVTESYPELKDFNLEFVRVLIMARDLKINIRRRAIGSFFEWDKLDRAAGGAHPALGKSFLISS